MTLSVTAQVLPPVFSDFTPAKDKRPFLKNWQQQLITAEQVLHQLNNPQAIANGIVGIIPEGYVILDCDGPNVFSAYLWKKLAKADKRSLQTLAWGSGPKETGRFKIVYRLPDGLEAPARKLVKKLSEEQKLELLFAGHPVTLPPSKHPDYGLYQYHCPQGAEQPILEAPDWLTGLINELTQQRQARFSNENLEAIAVDDGDVWTLLNRIDPDDYDDWVYVGMQLKGLGDEYLDTWEEWSFRSDKYRAGECDRKWRSFDERSGAWGRLCRMAGIKPPAQQRQRLTLQSILDELKRGKGKSKAVGFAPTEPPAQPAAPAPQPDIEYAPDERLQTWQQAMNDGYQFVLDQSATGVGKSWDSGNASPDDFGAKQLIYASSEHRNPSTPTLETRGGWVDLEARHDGLKSDEMGKLRRVKARESYDTPGNCQRTRIANALRAKHISGADTASLLCGGCSVREACQHTSGPGYGFLAQRRDALMALKVRSHPDSLPSPDDYDYENGLVLWDEPGESFRAVEAIQVFKHDVEAVVSHLITQDPELFQQLYPLLEWLLNAFAGEVKLGLHGLSRDALLQQLPSPAGIDIERLAIALSPNATLADLLNPLGKHGEDIADMPKAIRQRFANRDYSAAQEADQMLLKQWLLELVKMATGDTPGYLHIDKWRLTITIENTRHKAIARNAKAVVFLDATLTREKLAEMLSCAPEDICVMRQATVDHKNLGIIQVNDLGKLTMQRGADQVKRVEALVNHCRKTYGDTAVIDFKKFGADGAWWRDSRGVNDFQQVDCLVLVGTPCRNLAALEAEYYLLIGQPPRQRNGQETEAFRQFVNGIIDADMRQAIGRIRAHQRPGEELTVVILSNFKLSIPTRQVGAVDLCPAAGSKRERMERAITDAAAHLKGLGQKVTQTAIARIVGVSQGYISRFRELLQTLLESPNSKSNSPPDGIDSVAEAAFENSSGVAEDAEIVAELLDWLPTEQVLGLLEGLSRENYQRILTALARVAVPEPDLLEIST